MTSIPLKCRQGCGACCIAPSITSNIPGMPGGKPAGVACIHLDEHYNCRLFGTDQRPAFCSQFAPAEDVCGENREQALVLLQQWERATKVED